MPSQAAGQGELELPAGTHPRANDALVIAAPVAGPGYVLVLPADHGWVTGYTQIGRGEQDHDQVLNMLMVAPSTYWLFSRDATLP